VIKITVKQIKLFTGAGLGLALLFLVGCSSSKCEAKQAKEGEVLKNEITVPVAQQGVNITQGVITPGVSPCMRPDAPKDCVFEAPSVAVKLYVAEPSLEGSCRVLGEVDFKESQKGAKVQIPTPAGKICLFEQKNFECIQSEKGRCIEIKGDCGVLPIEFFIGEYSGCLDVLDEIWTEHSVERNYP
jgi:hypothetical protein